MRTKRTPKRVELKLDRVPFKGNRFTAICTCGWHSVFQPSLDVADDDAIRHVREHDMEVFE